MVARRDYSITGEETKRAFERGLVSAEWYQCDVPRKRMKELMQRSDWPGLWWQGLWFALIIAAGALVVWSWGTWWLVPTLFVYGTLITGAAASPVDDCAGWTSSSVALDGRIGFNGGVSDGLWTHVEGDNGSWSCVSKSSLYCMKQ